MSSPQEDLTKAIDNLTISNEEKTVLKQRLNSEGPSDGLLLEIKKHIENIENQLPEAQELQDAEKKFNTEMDQIEKETDELDTKVMAELNKVDRDSTVSS